MNILPKRPKEQPPIMTNFYCKPPTPEWVKAIYTLVDTAERFDGKDNDLRDDILKTIQKYIGTFIENDKKTKLQSSE